MKKNYGKQLRKLRKQSGLTLEELSKKISCRTASLSQWENSLLPSIKGIMAYCEFFKVSLSDFFSDDTEVPELSKIKNILDSFPPSKKVIAINAIMSVLELGQKK